MQRELGLDGLCLHNPRMRRELGLNGLTFPILVDTKLKCRQSNCWDNAVVESFFGTLKVELGANDYWKS